MKYDDALNTAIDLSLDPEALDAFLAQVPADVRQRLRDDLEVAATARTEFATLAKQVPSGESAKERLLSTVNERAATARERDASGWVPGIWPLRMPALAASITALFVLVATTIFATGVLGGGSTRAEAVVVEGTLAEIGPGTLTLNSAGSTRTVHLSTNWKIEDGLGNPIDPSSLQPGQVVVLTGRGSNSDLVVERLEIKDKLFGIVVAVNGDQVRVRVGEVEYVVVLTPDTEIDGDLAPGVQVEIEIAKQQDGTLLAEEIEVVDDDHDDAHEPHETPFATPASQHPGAGPTAVATPPFGEHDDDDAGGKITEPPHEGEDDGQQHDEHEDDEHEDGEHEGDD